jgi:hypothetical protein
MYSAEHEPAGETGAPEVVTEDVTLAAVADPPISLDGPRRNRGFLDELAQAMQATAERERERMSAEVDVIADAHVEKVRTRGASEAEELRKLAEDDIAGIHAWNKAETVRIREEAERRIGVRREELDSYLIRHTALIDGEVGHIGGAVEDYHHELDAFFSRLSAQADPAEFARLADDLPEPPDLAKVGSDARAAAVAELAREEDAPVPIARGAGSDGDGPGPAGDGGPHQLGAFDPGARGPELVPVMNEAVEAADGSAKAGAPGETPAAPASDDAALPDGAVATARTPIETVIPAMTDAGASAASAKTSTTPVAAATDATMRFLRSLAHQPRPASQHKD